MLTNEFWDTYGIHVPPDARQRGDLVFFSTGIVPTHIAIVVDEEYCIHSPGRDNERVRMEKISQIALRQTGIVDGPYSSNPIGYKSPVIPMDQPDPRYHQRPV